MPFFRTLRWVITTVSLLAIAGGMTGIAAAQGQGRHVLRIEVEGIINPVVDRFIGRAVERAEEREAELLVIRLDTPVGERRCRI